MTKEELIEKLNNYDNTHTVNVKNNGSIESIDFYYSSEDEGNVLIANIPLTATHYNEVQFNYEITLFTWHELQDIFTDVKEYVDTPLSKRESLYRLRWFTNDSGLKCYLYFKRYPELSLGIYEEGSTLFKDKNYLYSSEYLNNLKKRNPELAKVIDILKESVN